MDGAANYNVLDTDYTTYSIVYSCRDAGWSQKSEDMWILSRDTTISDELLATIKTKMKEQVPDYDQDWWLTYPKQGTDDWLIKCQYE